MSFLIGPVIIVLAIVFDMSGIKQRITGKRLVDLEERGTDERIELYKTLSYIFLGLFVLFSKYIQITIPCVLIWNILAFIRYLRKPDLIRKACLEKKTMPTLARMFLVSGVGMGILILVFSVKMTKTGVLLIVGVGLVLFVSLLIRGLQGKANIKGLMLFTLPIGFFVVGFTLAINSFYGTKRVTTVDTVVADIRINKRSQSFFIPEGDAIDGKTRFRNIAFKEKVGDKVRITEYEGGLGIRWFVVVERKE